MKDNTVLAVDLGGTKLLIGEVDHTGKILGSKKYESGYLTQYEAMELIKESTIDYIDTVGFAAERPRQMGIGVIGLADVKEGIWKLIDAKRKIDIPLATELEVHTGMKCYIDNDVKAAARAEKAFGGGRGCEDFIYLNIGTGIAAGIFAGARLIRGRQNDAGEVGHMVTGVIWTG